MIAKKQTFSKQNEQPWDDNNSLVFDGDDFLSDGKTALMCASENFHDKVVEILLNAGADHAASDK